MKATTVSIDPELWEAVFWMSPDWNTVRTLNRNARADGTSGDAGSWLQSYVHPDDRARVALAIQEAIERRGIVEVEHRLLCADGRMRRVLSRALPLLGDSGQITEWLCTARAVASQDGRPNSREKSRNAPRR
jgi:PAS domain-containing protein